MTHEFTWRGDAYLNPNYNWDPTIAETCIIGLPQASEQAQDCKISCEYVGQPRPRIFWGYDGTDQATILTPERFRTGPRLGFNGDFESHGTDPDTVNVMSWIKVLDPALSITEVACALSHISLWAHCININKPIVIMEHDAYMIRPFTRMSYTNSVEYLGHDSEMLQLLKSAGVDTYHQLIAHYKTTGQYPRQTLRLPVTMLININFLFTHGLHAYAIDPFMARRLWARVLTEGITNPIDVVVEVTDFELVQTGVYATLGPSKVNSSIDPGAKQTRKDTYSIPGVSQ